MFRFLLKIRGLVELSLETDQRDLAVIGALLVVATLLALGTVVLTGLL